MKPRQRVIFSLSLAFSTALPRMMSAFASFELKPSSFVLLKGKAFKLPMLIIAVLFLFKRQEMKR